MTDSDGRRLLGPDGAPIYVATTGWPEESITFPGAFAHGPGSIEEIVWLATQGGMAVYGNALYDVLKTTAQGIAKKSREWLNQNLGRTEHGRLEVPRGLDLADIKPTEGLYDDVLAIARHAIELRDHLNQPDAPLTDELDLEEPRVYLAAGETWNVEYGFMDYDGNVTVVIETSPEDARLPVSVFTYRGDLFEELREEDGA